MFPHDQYVNTFTIHITLMSLKEYGSMNLTERRKRTSLRKRQGRGVQMEDLSNSRKGQFINNSFVKVYEGSSKFTTKLIIT